ncbi:acetyltransferase [Flavobacterium urumqiense]|uniref:Lipopolysaccharide O-acetyltransferase n=1 Tax=Flavobacterium urumqiense TaxID=935224 RepID=A0A1H5Y0M8_9FLAO|nr:acetyltransferase [Flavobacterium urumqiense]SEG17511.1 lipopolysaccharide O-acetyltransferase [Flavobacterium urumqiense]
MIKRYGIIGFVKLFVSLIYTKLFHRNARLIRLPFDIRNSRYIQIGDNFTTGVGCRLEAYPENENKVLHIGRNVEINDYVHISAKEDVTIGDNVLIASKVFISDLNHGSYGADDIHDSPNTPPNERELYAKAVIIQENVWLGESVSVLSGVTIGRGTIVGANSVVSKSLPSYVIAVGIPAKVIKKYNFVSERWEDI